MAIQLTGTPIGITWEQVQEPTPQSITIPADCVAVYMFWRYYSANASGLASVSLNGNAPDENYEQAGADGRCSHGVVVWYNPATGSQSLGVNWDTNPPYGPTCIVVFVKGCDTSGWLDVDADHQGAAASEITINSNTTDLVLNFSSQYDSSPGTQAGFTSQQTHNQNYNYSRLSVCDSPGASTTTVNSIGTNYSGVIGVSILAGADSMSFFSDSTVADGTNVVSYINKTILVNAIQSDSSDNYFDSTDKLNKVYVYYTDPGNRELKSIRHEIDGTNLKGYVSWSPFAGDGTWQKIKVKAYDLENALHVLNRAAIGSGEDITHSSGIMHLNRI